jgi:hypothetical protein
MLPLFSLTVRISLWYGLERTIPQFKTAQVCMYIRGGKVGVVEAPRLQETFISSAGRHDLGWV